MDHECRRSGKGSPGLRLLLAVTLLAVGLLALPTGVALAATTGVGGTVTDRSDNPLAGITVSVYPQDYSGGPASGTATTAADGTYAIGGLSAGFYWAEFYDHTGAYASQIYDGHDLGGGPMDYISVTDGSITSDIDAELQIGGKISGRITDGNGIPLTTVWACVYVNGAGGYFANRPAGIDGTYTIGGLAPGSYNVEFIDFAGKYASQWYDDQADQSGAAVITVSSGRTTSAVDAVMQPAPGAVIGPLNAIAPTMSGSAALGRILSCTSGLWSGVPDPAYTYQWLRNGRPIPGAMAAAYTVHRSDCGQRLSCQVTASNSGGLSVAASAAVNVQAAPVVALRASRHALTAGGAVVLSGTIRHRIAAARTVCICRRLNGKLIVLRHLTLSSMGTFRWTWLSHRGGLWRFVASYTAVGCRFTSPAVSVAVHRA